MRALSHESAYACENATGGRCRCRCAGLLHGAARGVALEDLPEEDPHHYRAEPEPVRRRAADAEERVSRLEIAYEERGRVLRALVAAARASGRGRVPESLRLAIAAAEIDLL